MRLTTIAHLHRARLRARLGQELLSALGIAVGVALLFASQIANTSLSGSVSRFTSGLVGSARLQLTARDTQGFDERLLAGVRRLPSVSVAAPVLQSSVTVVGAQGSQAIDLIGVQPSFIGLKGRLLGHVSANALSDQRGIALPAPVAQKIGAGALQAVSLQIGARTVPTTVATTLGSREIGEIAHSPIAIAPLALAQSLTGMQGKISRILVVPRAGREVEAQSALRRLAAGHLSVQPADFDATLFAQAEAPTEQSTELFSAISALVGFLFAFNAMLLTAPQRRKLIGDLRLDGYTPLEIVQVILYDALVLGLVGSLAGLLLGDLLSRDLLQTSPGYLSYAFPVGSLRVITLPSMALALAGGTLAAIVGVLLPLRLDAFVSRPVRIRRPPLTARHSLAGPMLGATLCAIVAAVILLTGVRSVQAAIGAVVCLLLGLLATLPVAFRAAAAIFDRLQRPIMGVASHLAAIELQSSSTRARSLAIAATGAVAVFGSVAIQGAQRNLQHGLDEVSSDITRVTDLWVSPKNPSDVLATTPFQSHLARELRRVAGVAEVSAYRGAFLDIGDRRVLVIGPPRSGDRPIPPTQVIDGHLARADALLREGGWVVLSQELARAHRLRIGDTVTLPAPNPVRLRLAATTSNFGWPAGAMIVNADDFARAWGSSDPSAYEIELRPNVAPELVERDIAHLLGPGSALSVQSAAQREATYRATQHQGLARLDDIAALVLIAAAVAMATAMGALIWQRRRRLSGMKVDGFDHRELWRALLYESAVLLGTGCSLGAAFGLVGQLVLSRALVTVTGFPVIFSPAVAVAAAMFAIVTVSAVIIVALPGYAAAQVRPALGD